VIRKEGGSGMQNKASIMTLIKNKDSYYIRRRTSDLAMNIFRFIVVFSMMYLFLFPVFYMLITSVQTVECAMDPTVMYIPKEISFEAFKTVFKLLEFPRSSILSLIIVVFSTLGSLISCSLTGYVFARFNFKGKNIIFIFVLLMILVPQQTLVMSNFLQFHFFDFGGILSIFGKSINLLDTPWVFILPSFFASGLKAGLFIFIFRQSFSGMPKELEEAATVDGCGTIRTFAVIMAPNAIPTFITVLLFSVIWHWNEFYSSSMYFLKDVKPIMVMLNNLQTALQINGVIATGITPYQSRMYLQAGAFLSILPPMILYLFTQKYFTESIDRAGIVG
jgi:multiple sugar transport system permease protein